MKYLSIYSL